MDRRLWILLFIMIGITTILFMAFAEYSREICLHKYCVSSSTFKPSSQWKDLYVLFFIFLFFSLSFYLLFKCFKHKSTSTTQLINPIPISIQDSSVINVNTHEAVEMKVNRRPENFNFNEENQPPPSYSQAMRSIVL